MSDQLYIAMAGAQSTMLAQSINSNNLANVSTPGFRADLFNASQHAIGGTNINPDVYAVSEKPVSDFTPGAIRTTGRDLDVAVQGKGWLVVQRPDGSEGLTRAGSLQLTASGQLQTPSGLPVMGNGGPIAIPPSTSLDIAPDGTITVQPQGQAANALAVVDRLKLVNPDESKLQKGLDGLFTSTDGEVTADASVKIVSGALESSNVNAVGAMVDIIALARQFEMQVKIMQETESNSEILAQLLQL